MNIALLGYGTVGKSVAELLTKQDIGITIKKILRRPGAAAGPLMTDSFDEILADPDISCIMEALPGKEPALGYIRDALRAGKHVVTSNKAALAADFPTLLSLAKEHNVSLLYEASCGGGIPWLENLKKAARLNKITALSGILNGTSNYILDKMDTEGCTFEEALKDAQALGYAEADPTADIGGFDVYNKALISCSLAYQTPICTDFPVCGIEKLTKEILNSFHAKSKSLRLMMLSVRKDNHYAVGVAPVVLPSNSIEANVHLNYNCASLTGDLVGELKFYGQGAGGYPTADAVLQDLLQIRDNTAQPVCLDQKLLYDDGLLTGTGYFADGKILSGKSLAELTALAHQSNVFMAFEPDPA
ncbi:MAG: homoserine dehydrogenase [Eubacteriales bacterium]|nr:homoserine dehydrogenase [Eubacteriales bacterium]